MRKVMEDMRKESLQEGVKEGAINTAKRMLADGMLTLEKIESRTDSIKQTVGRESKKQVPGLILP